MAMPLYTKLRPACYRRRFCLLPRTSLAPKVPLSESQWLNNYENYMHRRRHHRLRDSSARLEWWRSPREELRPGIPV